MINPLNPLEVGMFFLNNPIAFVVLGFFAVILLFKVFLDKGNEV